jgi:hypothetical protein
LSNDFTFSLPFLYQKSFLQLVKSVPLPRPRLGGVLETTKHTNPGAAVDQGQELRPSPSVSAKLAGTLNSPGVVQIGPFVVDAGKVAHELQDARAIL